MPLVMAVDVGSTSARAGLFATVAADAQQLAADASSSSNTAGMQSE
jgi:ribulose kinase